MIAWPEELHAKIRAGHGVVLVTLIAIRGSAPREAGAKMMVTADGCSGSIGGGQLEFQCAQLAAGMLGSDGHIERQKFPLGTQMGQCCGGVVEVLFESILAGCPLWLEDLLALRSQSMTAVVVTPLSVGDDRKVVIGPRPGQATTGLTEQLVSQAHELIEADGPSQIVDDVFLDVVNTTGLNIAVFGAGHVGSAVVTTLSGLDAQIRWVDSRAGVFEAVPVDVRAIETQHPVDEVAAMPPAAFYLVMTHSHGMDFDICQAVLAREDAAYCGLIGSRSKRRQFEKRFHSEEADQVLLDQLTCPIGIDGIRGKTPKEIAIAVAAEILQFYDRERTTATGGHL